MRSLFILPTLDASVGRHFNHIDAWRKNDVNNVVCAFDRGGKVKRERSVDVILGRLEHSKVYTRFPIYRKALERLMSLVSRSDVVFVYTLDTFVFAWMAKVAAKSDIKIVFFVLDIRDLFVGNSLINNITQSFLMFAFERCELIIVSSKKYITEYAENYLRETPPRWLEIENKIDSSQMPTETRCGVKRGRDGQIVIGYFGLIRCARSIEILLEFTQRMLGKFRVEMRGIFLGVDHLIEAIQESKWIDYNGPYYNPDDLASVYASCDIVWACYPYSEKQIGNHQWAKTNRFYESGFFRKPMIASEGTQDGIAVLNGEMGLVIDLSNREKAIHVLEGLTFAELSRFEATMREIEQARFTYSNEFQQLYQSLTGDSKE